LNGRWSAGIRAGAPSSNMGADRNPIKLVAMIKIENGQMNFAGWVSP
jgi:hypothetical protein